MVSKVNCCAITGTEVLPICVETDVCSGLPSFDMVGLLSSEIKESRERVRTAIKNSGFMIPPRRITINLIIRYSGAVTCRLSMRDILQRKFSKNQYLSQTIRRKSRPSI